MKNFSQQTKKTLKKTLIVAFAACAWTQISFASNSKCPAVIVIPAKDQCISCDIIRALQAISCKQTEMVGDIVKDIAYATDKYIEQTIIPTNTALLTSKQKVNDQTSRASSSLISYYFAGVDAKTKNSDDLDSVKAEDVSGQPPQMDKNNNYKDYTQYVFNQADQKQDAGTAIFNTDTLLGPLQYNDQQKNDAQTLIRILETLSPIPDIIRISNKFQVPYSPSSENKTGIENIDLTDKDTQVANVSPTNNVKPSKKVQALLDELNTKPEYRKYKANYRSSIAARTILLNNLLKIYQERVVPTTASDSKSQAQLDYDAATWRLNKDYYNYIQTASPSVVNRETVLLLAEMRHEFYQIRQQGEQMIAMQTLLGLQSGQMSSIKISSQTKQIAKLIYCIANEKDGKQPESCNESSAATSVASGDSSSISSMTDQAQASIPK